MRAAELKGKKIAIWGMGREGRAAASWLHKLLPGQAPTLIDEKADAEPIEGYTCVTGSEKIGAVLDAAEVIIKSPGVSLYHPLIEKAKTRGAVVTSLLNLWFAEKHGGTTVAITGTKGKSTTASLLAHVLKALGKKTALLGNIGVPVTAAPEGQNFYVVEVSSYQASDFSGTADFGLLTALYPEHLDWHRSLNAYYRDKLNLLAHSLIKIVNHDALDVVSQNGVEREELVAFNNPSGLHAQEGAVYDGDKKIGALRNAHLSKPHNLVNVCSVLTVIKQLGFDMKTALQAMENYQGLPHRQQELGTRGGVLYIDDSISTTPQSAIAALEAYAGRPLTLIAGGYDRGIDYASLTDYVLKNHVHAVICLGPSGRRIYDALRARHADNVHLAVTLTEAVQLAQGGTPAGGAVLLSPAAPSYGLFKDFEERGRKFAELVGQIKENGRHAKVM